MKFTQILKKLEGDRVSQLTHKSKPEVMYNEALMGKTIEEQITTMQVWRLPVSVLENIKSRVHILSFIDINMYTVLDLVTIHPELASYIIMNSSFTYEELKEVLAYMIVNDIKINNKTAAIIRKVLGDDKVPDSIIRDTYDLSFLPDKICDPKMLNWKFICKHFELSEEHILANAIWLHWDNICKYQIVTPKIVEEHSYYINTKNIFRNKLMTDSLKDKVLETYYSTINKLEEDKDKKVRDILGPVNSVEAVKMEECDCSTCTSDCPMSEGYKEEESK